MKILMFGWEFPPHISGGLGTACHGLTQALGNEAVEILFVVPTLKGGEKITNGNLIDASTVIVPVKQSELVENSTGSLKVSSPDNLVTKTVLQEQLSGATQPIGHEEIETKVSYVKVKSSLSPYQQSIETKHTISVQKWNYSFPETFLISNIYPELSDHHASTINGISYDFTGGYGATLFDEIDKYAIVANVVSTQYYFDIIHIHDWITFPAGIVAKKTSGKPLIVHLHATEFDRAGNNGNPAVQKVEREGLLAADRVIAVSERTKAIAVQQYGIPTEKIEVVHNGIIAKKNANNFSIPIGSHIVSFLGRVTYQKGPLYFVEAARKVLEEFPDAHFVMAGSGDMLPLVIERVAQLRMSENFHFTGFVKGEQVEKIWSISDVYVMPSVSEPFGITPLEAIQAGVPIIISNQAGVSEVMPHAIKIDFWNTGAMAEAICSVLKYRSLSKTLRKNSSEEIKNLNWNKAAKKIKNLYDEITTTTKDRRAS
jgi:glycogen synthase